MDNPSHRSEGNAARLCFQHDIRLERVISVESGVQTKDLQGLISHHAA